MYKSHNKMSLLRDMKLMSREKSVDLTGVLSCRETLLESLRHNHLRLDIVTPLVGKETPIHFMSFRLVSIRCVQLLVSLLYKFLLIHSYGWLKIS